MKEIIFNNGIQSYNKIMQNQKVALVYGKINEPPGAGMREESYLVKCIPWVAIH